MASLNSSPPPGVAVDQHQRILELLTQYEDAATDKSPILKLCNGVLKEFRALGWMRRKGA